MSYHKSADGGWPATQNYPAVLIINQGIKIIPFNSLPLVYISRKDAKAQRRKSFP